MTLLRLLARISRQPCLQTRARVGAPRRTDPRAFTHDSRLRFVSPVKSRPQLPFLHSGPIRAPGSVLSRTQLQRQIARFLTTETKKRIRYQVIQGVRYAVIIAAIQVLIWSLYHGISTLLADYKFPSPREWSFLTRLRWQNIKRLECGDSAGGFPDWATTMGNYQKILERLESTNIDGAGLRPIMNDNGDLYIEGGGKTGFDITAQSEEWRRGYFCCLLGAAKAAENIDGWTVDRRRNMAFPANSVIGPSNPDPTPLEPGAPAPPQEADVEAFETPTVYYMKLLTTHGFTSRQRLEAALAYANWLEYKGLLSTAEDMYDWGLDIAIGSLPYGSDDAMDIKTGIISNNAKHVSSNMLTASTALASYHARQGILSAAMPIFLSVLRARRNLPLVEKGREVPEQSSSYIETVRSAFAGFPMPKSPPSGDETPERRGPGLCDEAGLMSNIGEVVFASGTSRPSDGRWSRPAGPSNLDLEYRQAGLSWTREAMDLAEFALESEGRGDPEVCSKCGDCLRNVIENWNAMVGTMLKEEKAAELKTNSTPNIHWFWRSNDVNDQGRWEKEANVVAKRAKGVEQLISEVEREHSEKRAIVKIADQIFH